VLLGVYGLGILGAAVVVWFSGDEVTMPLAEMVAVIAVLPLMAFVITSVGAWINGVVVSREGIRALTLAFHRRTVRWDAIRDVCYAELQGYPFLALESTDTRWRLYVPLGIAERERFEQLVEEYAGPDHPISRWYVAARGAAEPALADRR
jgi:hypothetical protein